MIYKSKSGVLVFSLLVIAIFLSGCTTSKVTQVRKPSPVVQSVDCDIELQGLNAVAENSVLVTNTGYAGQVLVEGKFVSERGSTYSDTKTIYMDSGESKYVNFIFDITWDEEGSCMANARAL